jgi:membrane peptidoglycan carboxypeptidase
MTEKNSSLHEEDPRERFRRLLDEAEKAEKEATVPLELYSAESTLSQADNQSDDSLENIESDDHKQPSENLDASDPVDEKPEGDEFLKEIDPDEIPTTPQTVSDTPPPPMLGTTPQTSLPAVDTQGMPLPRRVDEIDLDATQVTSAAFEPRYSGKPATTLTSRPPAVKPAKVKPRKINFDIQKGSGCALRMMILGLFSFAVVGIVAGSFMLFWYYSIIKAEDWPDVGELYQRTSQFETTRILDRNGNVLYEIMDPNAGRRNYVSLEEISPYLVAATIATEDKDFYSHPGFDPTAIVRAFWQNISSGETVSGASTITQQLARSLFLTPQERAQGTYTRKVKEALLAVELTRLFTKDEILELYLNEIYYGNLAYGIEAAAQTYFGLPARNLTLAQGSFLGGLPQLPGIYDIYTNREVTLRRQQDVLLLMFQTSQEQGCIYVSNNPQAICIEAGKAAEAAKKMENYDFNPPDIRIRYPHWVNYVRGQLEEQFDPQTIYRSGFSVYTTLDPGLQDAAQQVVQEQINLLADRHVTNGSLVAIRPATGEILVMVGSADFYKESIDGQVNMAISPRQPGSSIKPLTYLSAFEKGWTPSTLLWDVRSEFPPSGDPNDPRDPYIPVNYDDRYHGPVTVRSALANSYNIPAVKTLQFIGIFDNPGTPYEDGLVAIARRLGIYSLTRNDYGLSLTLGGGDVSLLEMVGAYSVIANGGRKIEPVAITRIEDHLGNLIFQYDPPAGEQVIRLEHAYIISSILSDNQARIPAFGPNSVINLPFQTAAKTGTTNDFRDNWTIGYTPDLVVGTWVGNADYTPMQGTSGLTGAAPIWATFMQSSIQQLTGGNPTPFIKPAGVVERVVCAISGTEPSQWCPSQHSEYFAADQLPLPKGYDLWQKASIDTWTGLLSSPECSEFIEQKTALNVDDPWAVKWIKETDQGKTWAKQMGFDAPIFFTPNKTCNNNDPRPLLSFASIIDGMVVTTSPQKIYGRAGATSGFYQYRLEYGFGDDPVDWELLDKSKIPVNEPEELYEWDISELPAGIITLRLYLISTEDTYAETRITLDLQLPTPTPTETPTATWTPSPTATSSPTLTPTATNTLFPTSTGSPTLVPSNSPTPSATPSPTPSPTP